MKNTWLMMIILMFSIISLLNMGRATQEAIQEDSVAPIQSQRNLFQELPQELQTHVFAYLNQKDLISLTRVDSDFYKSVHPFVIKRKVLLKNDRSKLKTFISSVQALMDLYWLERQVVNYY